MKTLNILVLLFAFITYTHGQLDRSTAPKAAPAPKIQIGQTQSFELKNGLKVFVVENHKLPTISYSLTLDIPPLYEGDATGYSNFAGELLAAGTTNRSKEEIDETIDFIGASLHTSSRGIYGRSLTKHSETLLNIFSDVLLNPTFPEEEVTKLKTQALTSLSAEKEEPSAIANNITNALLYGKTHAFGEIQTESDIENINAQLLKEYFTKWFNPSISYLVIVGDINLEDAKAQTKKYFGKWKKGDTPNTQIEFPDAFPKTIVAIGNKEGANQSTLKVSYCIDFKPGNPDAVKTKVMNGIFGGKSFSARLFQNLREDKAYTYGAYSNIRSNKYIGSIDISTKVKGEVTDSAVYQILHEMNRIVEEPVSQEELDLVKNSMAGAFARSLEDPKTVADFALNIEKYHLPKDYYETYLERLAAVSIEDIQEMAKKYIKPNNALILAVGDVAKLKEQLKQFSPNTEIIEYNFYGDVVK